MRASLAVVPLLLAATTATGGAQEPRLAARLADADRAQVEALLDSARAAGLPAEPLVDRALEGATKRAPGERIVAAVRRLLGELRSARDALGSLASVAEITAGASALRAGARPEDLAELRRLRGQQPVTLAAGALADLVAIGVPPDSATDAVLELASEASDAEYLAFRRNVERDVSLGASPSAALGVRLTAFRGLAEATSDGPTSRAPRKP